MRAAAKKTTTTEGATLSIVRPPAVQGNRIGRLCPAAEEGVAAAAGADPSTDAGPRVDYPGNPHGPLVARSTVPLSAETVRSAIAEGREVLLAFDGGRSDQPIIVGLLEPKGAIALVPPPASDVAAPAPASDPFSFEARVDGKRIQLEAQDEIELRCGQASIVLRRNGRITIRGAYVETRSRGVNRIKGGAVRIN